MTIMFQYKYDKNLLIEKNLSWGMLKYGLCSYFALAYANQNEEYNRFFAVMEYDEDLEKEYLVHILVVGKGVLIDSEGEWVDWRDAVGDIADIQYMTLRTREINKDSLIELIKKDIGFNTSLYQLIEEFVSEAYA